MPRKRSTTINYPWLRQPRESSVSYAYFLKYRDMGLGRTLEKLATQDGVAVSGQFFRWCSNLDWVARTLAWDNYLQAERDKEAVLEARKWEKRRQEALESNWQSAQKLREKSDKMLAWPIQRQRSEDGKTIVEPARWTFQTAARLARSAAEIEVAVLNAVNCDVDQLTDTQIRIYDSGVSLNQAIAEDNEAASGA